MITEDVQIELHFARCCQNAGSKSTGISLLKIMKRLKSFVSYIFFLDHHVSPELGLTL